MGSSVLQIALYSLGGVVLGAACAWIVQAVKNKRHIARITDAALTKLDAMTTQRDELAHNYSRSTAKIESLRSAIVKRKTETRSVFEKSKLLARNVLTLRTERENTKVKLSDLQNALGSVRKQTAALQSEFGKTQEFYKRELAKSLQKRKELEQALEEARAEQDDFARMVESSSLEHGSQENMVVAAQLRLGQLEVLQRNVNKLEAENAELGQDILRTRQELAARERDLAELEELKIHNKQLVQCVETLENSRKEHESDADRYREQADHSEKLSDTLRLKLEDLEKNFADIEKQQDEAIGNVRQAAAVIASVK